MARELQGGNIDYIALGGDNPIRSISSEAGGLIGSSYKWENETVKRPVEYIQVVNVPSVHAHGL